MSTSDLLPDLVAELDRLVPPEAGAGDWDDVLRRVDPPRRRRARPARKLVLLAGVLFVLLVAVAAATYLILQHRPRPGALTVAVGGYNLRWPVQIIQVMPNGRSVVLWRCPSTTGCGEPEGMDWAPDGRHVAFTVDAFNGARTDPYLGLHVLDLQTNRDVRVVAEYDAAHARPRCLDPAAVAWSPDSKMLAFDCTAFGGWSWVWLAAPDGSQRRRLPTGNLRAAAPSWSPDGTRIVFAASDGGIYIVRLDGSGLRRVVTHGSVPDWSPDGSKIAYEARDGVRLVTPTGQDVTPLRGIGPAGTPVWSPDGREIAVTVAGSGLYVVDSNGRDRHHVPIHDDVGSIGRPAWYPAGHVAKPVPSPTSCQAC
jgi:WD40 repeat protein